MNNISTRFHTGALIFTLKRTAKQFSEQLSKPQKIFLETVKAAVVFLLVFMFILYGPLKNLTDLYITTAMRTSDHQYLATAFYSDEYISKVLGRNSVGDMEGLSEYTESAYIGSDVITVEDIADSGYTGKLLTVYDETRVQIVFAGSESGMLLENFAQNHSAAAAINASGYRSNAQKGVPSGFYMHSGAVGEDTEERQRSFVATDYYGRLYMGSLMTSDIIAAGFRDVVEFGPLLVLNGQPCDISGNGGGLAPRTAIGITADRRVLLLVIDGRDFKKGLGASHRDVQRIMIEHGAVSVCNLDGGNSVSMYYNGGIINSPSITSERVLPDAIIVK